MALTPGFKKFIGLIAITGAVGGGLFFYKSMPKAPAAPQEVVQQTAPQAEESAIPQPYSSPIKQAEIANQVVDQVAPPEQPTRSAPSADASTNRGLANVLSQGKK
jgi:hypothetical protein